MIRLAGADAGEALPPPASANVVAARIVAVTLGVLAIGATGSRALPLPASTDLYDRAIDAVSDAPAWVGHGFEVVSELGLVILAGAFLLSAWRRRRTPQMLARSVASGVGVVAAYAMSETLKVISAQPRPCVGLGSHAIVAACPPANDWSLPSNHATIGMALAVALLLTVARAARWAVPLALVVAASRVVIGVHYPHDVGSGMLLAVSVVTVTALALQPLALVVVSRPSRRRNRSARRDGAGEGL